MESDSNTNFKRKILKKEIKEFLLTTTFHSIPNIAKANSKLLRTIWIVIFLISISFSIWSTINLIVRYLEFMVTMKYEMI